MEGLAISANYLHRTESTVMAELDFISDDIRRQRKDIDDALESSRSRTVENADLLTKIEELRKRAEATTQQAAKEH